MQGSDHQHPEHSSRTCQLCATLRHPALAAQGRALRAHLAKNPLPTQTGGNLR